MRRGGEEEKLGEVGTETMQLQRQMVERGFPGREGRTRADARRVFGRTGWLPGVGESCRRPCTNSGGLGTAGF